MERLEIIGLMSGTSLDGLDVAHVMFDFTDQKVQFEILNTGHYPYDESLKTQLENAVNFSLGAMEILNKELGNFYSDCVNHFISKKNIDSSTIAAIACHGQTILHQPANGFTLQIGCGTTLAVKTNIKVINDFRTKDIVLGGQGAPLVPIGDFDLFEGKADAFLNIGGFCNISFKTKNQVTAFDICPGNLPLNRLANSKGVEFDKNGEIARGGEINFFLLDLLNSLDYYAQSGPKSLGTEWLEESFYPLLKFDKEIESNLRTVTEHIATQISAILQKNGLKRVMLSGGGTKNQYLVERIQSYFDGEIVLPEEEIIDYKEALIFAYLGALYLNNKPNTIASVTGASRPSVSGVLHTP
ncbi:MAG: anhydro-N-acetylmuramic acid kinase [Bacteroidetes bacterium]|nr:MAG: anhydro-N-acetylmuramic acid kinase [Bacteroidota bacterium]